MTEESFMDRVNIDEVTGCWHWTGAITQYGYGQLSIVNTSSIKRFRQKSYLAHRWSYEHFIGPVPKGLELDHLCRLRKCTNPDHLEPVTHKVNCERGIKASKTHCIHNHELNEVNTYIKPNGTRRCRVCNAAATYRYQRREVC